MYKQAQIEWRQTENGPACMLKNESDFYRWEMDILSKMAHSWDRKRQGCGPKISKEMWKDDKSV